MQPERQTPCGLDHLVLYVDDLELSHEFWSERLGFEYVGTTSRLGADGRALPTTRFYSGRRNGALSHHDVALVHRPRTGGAPAQGELNHVAIGYADEHAWREQITYLESVGVEVRNKVRRGTIFSAHVLDPNGYAIELACELDRDLWQDDINGALNRVAVSID